MATDETQMTKRTLQSRIVSGSAVLLSGSGLTTAINLAYNILIARYLGPKGFGHATVVYTLLTLLSAVTLSFQIVATKMVAQQSSDEGKAAVYRGFHRSAWACGLLFALTLLLFRGQIAAYLNLPDSTLVALLAAGAAFYVPLGTRRGYIQGTYRFYRLAVNMVLEGAVRLGGSFLLITLGLGVRGVIAANAMAIAVAYLAVAPKLAARIPNPVRSLHALVETLQALVFFSGQVLINNCDIVLVEHFFPAREAGLYAAVAMVGRVIFAFSSAVVNTTFPLVAGMRDEARKDLRVIATSLMLVLGSGGALALGLYVAPARIWTLAFGPGFDTGGRYDLPHLLALYALATVVYSLSVVVITYEMSYKIANTSLVQLAFSALVIAGICRYHASLHQVILVQLILMAVLFAFIAFPFLVDSLTNPRDGTQPGSYHPVRLIRRLAADEVIAEFLRSDFHDPVFRNYHTTLRELVESPNLDNAAENAKRKALLFLRHLSLWKEIPVDTEWYEAEVREADLGNVKAFPRAQWRKLARGNFTITGVIETVRARRRTLDTSFLAKIAAIGKRLSSETPEFGAVILIGLNEAEPLTILDGNHRLVAAMLATPHGLRKLRFICGFSPAMTKCCWYNTNLLTLFRYGRNLLTQSLCNPEEELARLLEIPG